MLSCRKVINTVIQALIRALLMVALTGSLVPVQANLEFFLTPDRLAWDDYQPARDPEISPVIELGGEWHYRSDSHEGDVIVPSSFAGFEGVVTFSKRVEVPNEWRGYDLELVFFGVRHRAHVRFNESLIGTIQGERVPHRLRIPTQVLNFGASNIIELEVDNQRFSTGSLPLKSALFGPMNYGGIIREVFLQALPRVRMKSVSLVDTNHVFDTNGVCLRCDLQLNIELSEQPAERSLLHIEILSNEGGVVARDQVRFTSEAGSQNGKISRSVELDDPRIWDVHRPYLYRVRLTYESGKAILDRIVKPFGIHRPGEDIIPGRNENRPNYAIHRVEQWPFAGVSPNLRLLERDVSLLKDLGIDLVLSAFYPPHPIILNRCDSLGIGVLLEIPLFGVSDRIMEDPGIRNAALNCMRDLQVIAADHPCIVALGWGGNLDPAAAETGGVLERWFSGSHFNRPIFARICGRDDQSFKGVLFQTGFDTEFTEIFAPFNPQTADENQELIQSTKLMDAMQQTVQSKCVLVNSLNDWYGHLPLLMSPIEYSGEIHSTGLTTPERQPRAAYYDLAKYLENPQNPADRPGVIPSGEETPWEYLLFGFILTGLCLWMMRIDKLFRQNLVRSLAHLTRLVGDIRDRRFLQGSQSIILGLLISLAFGNLAASIGHDLISNPGFNAILQHLLPQTILMEILRSLFWHPFQGIFAFGVLAILWMFAVGAVMKLSSIGQRSRLSLIQALYLVNWSSVPLLLIMPVTAVYLRITAIPMLNWLVLTAIYAVLVWAWLRMVKSLSIMLRSGVLRPVLALGIIPLLVLTGFIVQLHLRYQTLYYLGYFSRLFNLE